MSDQIDMNLEGASAPPVVDTRLSYSSSTLLQNCEQKYYYHKVSKIPKDKDASERDDSHFHYGTSLHYILEMSMHEKPTNIMALLEYCVQTFGLKEEHVPHIHASVIQYLRLREGSGFKAVACEYEIEHPKIIGYIDLIEKREDGSWYISDKKTAATFYENKIAELPSNPQLNLYCSFYKEIAKKFDLDPKKFMGARYLVSVKSKAKKQAKESYADFVMRLVNKKHIKCVFITIPKELMRIDETRKEIESLHKKSMKLRKGTLQPERNFSYCSAFFRGCDFFKSCHGMEYSEFLECNKIIVEKT
jgi:hypothetical protein